jgi:hypothetical protein
VRRRIRRHLQISAQEIQIASPSWILVGQALNNAGQVVGIAYDQVLGTSGPGHPFIWDRVNGPVVLNAFVFTNATINETGNIG